MCGKTTFVGNVVLHLSTKGEQTKMTEEKISSQIRIYRLRWYNSKVNKSRPWKNKKRVAIDLRVFRGSGVREIISTYDENVTRLTELRLS